MNNLYIFLTCVSQVLHTSGYVFLHTWGQGVVFFVIFFFKVFLYDLSYVNNIKLPHASAIAEITSVINILLHR
jgi:hypothetical protein